MQLDEPYTFKTKAQTLEHLQNRLDCAVIPNLYVFSVKDWTEDRAGCLYFIDAANHKPLTNFLTL